MGLSLADGGPRTVGGTQEKTAGLATELVGAKPSLAHKVLKQSKAAYSLDTVGFTDFTAEEIR